MTLQDMSDDALIAAYRESRDRERDDWYDYGGEIAAAWEDALLVEAGRRGVEV